MVKSTNPHISSLVENHLNILIMSIRNLLRYSSYHTLKLSFYIPSVAYDDDKRGILTLRSKDSRHFVSSIFTMNANIDHKEV